MTDDEERRVRFFVSDVLARPDVKLPAVFGMVVGITLLEREFLVEQLYPACACPFPVGAPKGLLPLLQRACRLPSELTDDERPWVLRYKRGIIVTTP